MKNLGSYLITAASNHSHHLSLALGQRSTVGVRMCRPNVATNTTPTKLLDIMWGDFYRLAANTSSLFEEVDSQ